GFTGDRLAVFWMGRDDNKPTTLFGATGGLRAWRDLFAKLPTQPLSARPGAQQVPVVAGSLPADTDGCFWQGVQNLFGGGDSSSPAATPSSPSSSSTPIRN